MNNKKQHLYECQDSLFKSQQQMTHSTVFILTTLMQNGASFFISHPVSDINSQTEQVKKQKGKKVHSIRPPRSACRFP